MKETTDTQVIADMIGLRPGENVFREKKRGRSCKYLLQQQQDQVLQNLHFKLNRFTPTDKKFVLERFDAMLDSILLSLLKRGEMKKAPTKKAIEKADAKEADKRSAQDATTTEPEVEEVAAVSGSGVTSVVAFEDSAEPKEELCTEAVLAPELDVKDAAAGSVVTADLVPEESLPQIAEPKEAEAIVAAVAELGAVEK